MAPKLAIYPRKRNIFGIKTIVMIVQVVLLTEWDHRLREGLRIRLAMERLI